jgi:hypothetical protein
MLSSIKNFFVFSLLLLSFYNISGIGVCIEHAQHSQNHFHKTEHKEKENHASISQDDNCQCALHFQMNHFLLPEVTEVELPVSRTITVQTPQSKAITYSRLIDFFSSRAPPSFS